MENEPQPSTGVGVGVDNLGRGHGCSTADQSGNAAELADIQLVRAPGATGLVKGGGVRGEISVVAEPENGEVKRKRGRPPRSQGKVGAAAGSAAKKNKKEEENVCFICFDGGTLVLCDRRDCPKAYHPACVKRDEAFFRGRVRWNCGWHLCNICQKSAFFMCYTCPYSLCKGCVKQADVLSVRGNKGLCRTCMTTIMLIENVAQGSKEVVHIPSTRSKRRNWRKEKRLWKEGFI